MAEKVSSSQIHREIRFAVHWAKSAVTDRVTMVDMELGLRVLPAKAMTV